MMIHLITGGYLADVMEKEFLTGCQAHKSPVCTTGMKVSSEICFSLQNMMLTDEAQKVHELVFCSKDEVLPLPSPGGRELSWNFHCISLSQGKSSASNHGFEAMWLRMIKWGSWKLPCIQIWLSSIYISIMRCASKSKFPSYALPK